MKSFALQVVALGCSLLLAGCRGSSGTPGKPEGVGGAAAGSIVGKWATSASPEAASSRTTMAFLESGEYQYNSPMMLFGKPVTADVEAKEVAARVIMSGLWELDGDRLRDRFTEINQTASRSRSRGSPKSSAAQARSSCLRNRTARSWHYSGRSRRRGLIPVFWSNAAHGPVACSIFQSLIGCAFHCYIEIETIE
jgi:hypothetical protein